MADDFGLGIVKKKSNLPLIIIIVSALIVVGIVLFFVLNKPAVNGCTSNSDCQANQYCASGVCYPNGVCTPNFNCSAWSTCNNNQQLRTCTDLNSCPINNSNLPILSQACTVQCTPNWQTSDWSTCSGGTQTRTVNDLNNCNDNSNKPDTTQVCSTTNGDIVTDLTNVNYNRNCDVGGFMLGYKVTPNKNVMLLKVSKSTANSCAVTAKVVLDGVTLATSQVIGNDATFNILLISGKSYNIVMGNPNLNYGCYPDTTCSTSSINPIQGTNVIFSSTEDGVYSASNIVSITTQSTSLTCQENWKCGRWSYCMNGQETRTCTDSNNCGTSADKPTLSRSCSIISNDNNQYLILTTNAFDSHLTPLVNLRTSQGYHVKIENVDGMGYTQIKALEERYYSSGNLKDVLIVGDYNSVINNGVIAFPLSLWDSRTGSDWNYMDIYDQGTFPMDVPVGRIPFDSSATGLTELDAWINKLIYYENNHLYTNHRALLLAGQNIDLAPFMENTMVPLLTNNGYTISKSYSSCGWAYTDPPWQAMYPECTNYPGFSGSTDVPSKLNNNQFLVFYFGHSGGQPVAMEGWDGSVSKMSGTSYYIWFNGGCTSMQYDFSKAGGFFSDDALGSSTGGAIATIGSSQPTGALESFNANIASQIVSSHVKTLGEAFVNAGNSEQGLLFGDPATSVN